jgi:hypothetical protein
MSIEIENPTTLLEKVDAAANLVAQMRLAHMMHDEKQFNYAYQKASTLLADATSMIDEE